MDSSCLDTHLALCLSKFLNVEAIFVDSSSPGAGDACLRHLHTGHQLRHGRLKHGGQCAMSSCLKIIHFVCQDCTYFCLPTVSIYKHFACHFILVICCPNRNQFRRYTFVIKICPSGLTIQNNIDILYIEYF